MICNKCEKTYLKLEKKGLCEQCYEDYKNRKILSVLSNIDDLKQEISELIKEEE